MTPQMKYGLLGLYAVIGLGFALYQHFATHDLHGFAYHLGQGLVWPAVMFPAVGKLIGGVIMLLVVGTLILANS